MSYTHSKISSATVGSTSVSGFSFVAIPQNYTDLVIKLSLREDYASSRGSIYLTFNGSSTAVYSFRELRNRDATSESTNGSAQSSMDLGRSVATTSTSNVFSSTDIYIPNYAGSNYKSASIDSVTENNSSTVFYMNLNAGLWSNVAPITAITISATAGNNYVQYSSATLYGIKAEV